MQSIIVVIVMVLQILLSGGNANGNQNYNNMNWLQLMALMGNNVSTNWYQDSWNEIDQTIDLGDGQCKQYCYGEGSTVRIHGNLNSGLYFDFSIKGSQWDSQKQVTSPIEGITITQTSYSSAISSESKYNIYVENYKYDDDGNLEGMCNSTALMLPVTSSAYSQFLATSASSFNQSVTNALLENDLTLKHNTQSNNLNFAQNTTSNALSAIGNLLSLNFGGLASNASNLAFGYMQNQLANTQANENSQLNEHNIISMKNTKVNDMLTTPNSIKTAGNDTLFNLINSNQKVDLLENRYNDQQMSQAQEYFKRYGYKVNGYDYINLTCRKHYNYVKTNVCNIVGARIPHEYLDEIKSIFNNGITVWHMDNEGTTMFDYNNNVEVYN